MLTRARLHGRAMNMHSIPTGDALLLLSLSHHVELSAIATAVGWRVSAARDQGVARLAVLDARGALDDSLAAAPTLGDAARMRGGALLVLVSDEEVAALDAFYAAGATHFLVSPFREDEFAQALRFAWRHVECVANGRPSQAPGDHSLDPVAARDWIAQGLEHGEPIGVILVALSRFDLVNSGYGQAAGDALIHAAERRIAAEAEIVLSGDHVVTRTKGQEFLLEFDGGAEAAAVAETLSASFARPFAPDSRQVSVGARLGVAVARPGESVDSLVRRASDALDDARISDGATVRTADEPAIADALSVDLRRALDGGEIAVLFPPQVAIETGRIVGVEVLARWEHPKFGAVGADLLFAAADRADLGLALSDHIQRLALATAAAWPAPLADLRRIAVD